MLGMQTAVIFLLLCCATNGSRILGLFPFPGISHYQFFHPVMKALAEAGHEVTVVSHFPEKEPIDNYRVEVLKWKEEAGMMSVISLDVRLDFSS